VFCAQVIFILPFWWAVGFCIVGLRILCMLYLDVRTHLWPRGERRARAGFALMHLSYFLLIIWFVFFYQLVSKKEWIYSSDTVARRGRAPTVHAARWAAAWLFTLAVSHIIVYLGLAERNVVRERQIAAGRFWSMNAGLGRNLGTSVVQHQVDAMTDDEIVRKVWGCCCPLLPLICHCAGLPPSLNQLSNAEDMDADPGVHPA
jgi:hypothetical protein